jgi:hypothetical protein
MEKSAQPPRREIAVSGRSFGAERIVADGMHFTSCTFTGTVFVYFGGAVPIFEACDLREVSFDFGGPAKNAAQFIKTLIDNKVIGGL